MFKSQLGQRRVTQGSCPDRLTWIVKIFIFTCRRGVRVRRREDKADYKASTSVSQKRVQVLNQINKYFAKLTVNPVMYMSVPSPVQKGVSSWVTSDNPLKDEFE